MATNLTDLEVDTLKIAGASVVSANSIAGALEVTGATTLDTTLAVTGVTTLTAGLIANGGIKQQSQEITGDGAITIKSGLAILNKGSAIAATLADPTATTDDGKFLTILSITAQAHTVTIAGGLNGGGAAADIGTFGAAIGNGVCLVAWNGKWYEVPNCKLNVTFA